MHNELPRPEAAAASGYDFARNTSEAVMFEIRRVIVPTVASVLSAWGMLTSDLRYEVSRTHYGAGRVSAGEVRELFAGLEHQAAGRLRSWFGGPIAIERSAEMRYGEQIFEIDVSLDGLEWNAADLVEPNPRLLQRLVDDGKQALQVSAGGDFRHDTAEAGVQVGLRRDHVGEHGRLLGEDGGRSFVTGRLDGEEVHGIERPRPFHGRQNRCGPHGPEDHPSC